MQLTYISRSIPIVLVITSTLTRYMFLKQPWELITILETLFLLGMVSQQVLHVAHGLGVL